MHAISSYRGNRHTHTHPPTQPATNRQYRLQYTTPQLTLSVTTPGSVALYDIRLGNGAVYSYNSGTRTGRRDGWMERNGKTISRSTSYAH